MDIYGANISDETQDFLRYETADLLRIIGSLSGVNDDSFNARRKFNIESVKLEKKLKNFHINDRIFSSSEFSELFNLHVLLKTLKDIKYKGKPLYKGKNFNKAYKELNDLFQRQVRVKSSDVDSEGYMVDFDYVRDDAHKYLKPSLIKLEKIGEPYTEIEWNPADTENYEFSFVPISGRGKRKTKRKSSGKRKYSRRR